MDTIKLDKGIFKKVALGEWKYSGSNMYGFLVEPNNTDVIWMVSDGACLYWVKLYYSRRRKDKLIDSH